MALAMTPMASLQDDTMDIDIDMDVDIDVNADAPHIDEPILEDGEEPTSNQDSINPSLIPAIYLEDPSQETEWNKVHLRGVDDMSTDHVRQFATDHYPDASPHVQWVDDTSANLVYKESRHAKGAFLQMSQTPVTLVDLAENPSELRSAKPVVSHPASILTMRMAQVGDKKRRNAKDASRYYLMHPEADPRERMRREFAAGRPSRSENGDYTRRHFDDREHRRRRDHDRNDDPSDNFEASMYDDAPSKPSTNPRGRDLFSRISNRPRRRSASPTGLQNSDSISVSDSSDEETRSRRRRNPTYRDRTSPPRNAGKELFSSTSNSRPLDRLPRKKTTSQTQTHQASIDDLRLSSNLAAARRFKADLSAASAPSPAHGDALSPARNHRRSRAIDSRLEEDLAERFGRKSISLDSTKSVTRETPNAGKELFLTDDEGMSVRGSAGGGMSIKGRADARELFPAKFGGAAATGRNGNRGKELIDRIDGGDRRVRRRAGDLFD